MKTCSIVEPLEAKLSGLSVAGSFHIQTRLNLPLTEIGIPRCEMYFFFEQWVAIIPMKFLGSLTEKPNPIQVNYGNMDDLLAQADFVLTVWQNKVIGRLTLPGMIFNQEIPAELANRYFIITT